MDNRKRQSKTKSNTNLRREERELIELLRDLRLERAENRREYQRREADLEYQIAEVEVEIQTRRDSAGQAPVHQATAVVAREVTPPEFRVGDYVIITSDTGGLRGTRARIVALKRKSYELSVPGVAGTIIRKKGSVIPDNV